MAIKKSLFKSQFLYFFGLILIIFIFTNIQSLFLGQVKYNWVHFDFITILIVYFCLEKSVLFSAIISLIAGALFQVYSSSPPYFFIFYFFLIIIFSHFLSRLFIINSLFSKIVTLSFLILLKYILFYLTLNNHFEISLFYLISVYWKEYIATVLISFLIYPVFLKIDSLFVHHDSIKKW